MATTMMMMRWKMTGRCGSLSWEINHIKDQYILFIEGMRFHSFPARTMKLSDVNFIIEANCRRFMEKAKCGQLEWPSPPLSAIAC